MDILITGSWPINRRKTRTRLTVVGNRSFQTLQSNKKWRSANQHSARTQNGWTTQFPINRELERLAPENGLSALPHILPDVP